MVLREPNGKSVFRCDYAVAWMLYLLVVRVRLRSFNLPFWLFLVGLFPVMSIRRVIRGDLTESFLYGFRSRLIISSYWQQWSEKGVQGGGHFGRGHAVVLDVFSLRSTGLRFGVCGIADHYLVLSDKIFFWLSRALVSCLLAAFACGDLAYLYTRHRLTCRILTLNAFGPEYIFLLCFGA